MGFKPEVTMSRHIDETSGGVDYYTQTMAETSAQCRMHCEHDNLCAAVSATLTSDGFMCSLYNEGHFKPMPDEHSTFYRKNMRSGKHHDIDFALFMITLCLAVCQR